VRPPARSSVFFVCILQSERTGRYYIGSTEDVARRLSEPNAGKTKSTRAFAPWKLVHVESFPTRSEAVQREQQIKRMKSRSWIERVVIGQRQSG